MSRVISSDVSDDLAEQIEEVSEEGESRSATVKRLLRDGLDAHESSGAVSLTYHWVIFLTGLVLTTGAFMEVREPFGYLGLALVALTVIHSLARRNGWL